MAEYFRNRYPHVCEVKELVEQNSSIILFDTETTGLEENAKIIQFSAVLYHINSDLSLTETDSLNMYINPDQPVSDEITELTGITNAQLLLADKEDVAAPKILDFMSRAGLWGAYNADFDKLKLMHMARRTNIPYIEYPCIDVLIMARNVIQRDDIKNYKLGTITEYLCPGYQAEFHNSLEDVRATGQCFSSLLQAYQKIEKPVLGSEKLHVSAAKFWINPRQQNMRRLKVYQEGKDTGIFWEASKNCWSCKSDTASKKRFKNTDLSDMEEQVLDKYYKKYRATTMEDLARQMGHDYYSLHKQYLVAQKNKDVKPVKKEEVKEEEMVIELD